MKKRLGIILMLFLTIGCLGGCISGVEQIYSDDEKKTADSDTYGLDFEETVQKDNTYTGKLKISGTYSLWEFACDEDQDVTISYQFEVESEKGKLVLISPHNKVEVITSGESTDELKTKTLSLKKGKNRMKVVGKDKAEISFKLVTDKGSFQ